MQTPRPIVLLFVLSALGIATHLIPHNMGVSTVGAVGMLCAALLPLRYLVVPVLITVAVADVLNGTYGTLAMSFVYVGHIAATYAAKPALMSRVAPLTVVGAAVLSAVAFYLVSNITPMVMQYYPNTLAGWTACYVNGLPYLLRGLVANLVFGGLFFSFIHVLRQKYAHRLAAT